METETTIFGSVARELAGAFETATRPDGSDFYRLRSDAPAWLVDGEIPWGAHVAVDGRDPRLPDDFIYRLLALAADYVAEHADADAARDGIGEWASARVDCSIPRLFAWAAEHANNRWLADEAGENIPARHESFESYAVDVLQAAQALAAERVAEYAVSAVETEADARG